MSPIRISPQDEEESDDDNEEAAEEEADVTPLAFEHNKAVEANEDKGDSVVNEDERLA